jgi:hypothetical protein
MLYLIPLGGGLPFVTRYQPVAAAGKPMYLYKWPQHVRINSDIGCIDVPLNIVLSGHQRQGAIVGAAGKTGWSVVKPFVESGQ